MSNDETPYFTGFHVYCTRKSAEKARQSMSMGRHRVVVPVEVRDVRYEGTDGTFREQSSVRPKNLVANEIRLL